MKQVNLFLWTLAFFIEASDAQLKICWRIIISFVVLALFIDQTLWHFLYAKVAKVAEREYNSHYIRFYICSYKCAMTHAQQSLQTIKIKIILYYQLYLIYKRFRKPGEENEQTYMHIA